MGGDIGFATIGASAGILLFVTEEVAAGEMGAAWKSAKSSSATQELEQYENRVT
jgi:hypothetical protein